MIDFPYDIPFARLVGATLLQCADGRCNVACEFRPEFCNSRGSVHGGLCMTLLDLSMSLACASAASNTGALRCGTVEMKTSFLQPARGTLVAHAAVLQAGRRLAFCEAWLGEANGLRVAHATGTFAYLGSDAAEPSSATPSTPSQGH